MIRNILNIAHRGASEYLPDNSIESFDRALAEHADMIELDVRKTADGKLVLFHDWSARNTSGIIPDLSISRLVSHLGFDELCSCYEVDGLKLILLEQVLERYKSRIGLNIELKAGGYEEEVVAMIEQSGFCGNVVLSSFFPWVMRKIKDLNHNIKTGWIIGQEQVMFLNRLARPFVSLLFKKLKVGSAHLHYEIITPSVLNAFHADNIRVYAWTVNNIEVMKTLIEMGVDGIITDRPGVLNSIVDNQINSLLETDRLNYRMETSGKKA